MKPKKIKKVNRKIKRTAIYVNRKHHTQLKRYLKKSHMTVSEWIRFKMADELGLLQNIARENSLDDVF